MRFLLKLVFASVGIAAIGALAVICWFRFYTRDLPDVNKLADFAPATPVQAFDFCFKRSSKAIPYDAKGSNLRYALNAVGVTETGPSILSATYHGFAGDTRRNTATLSWQISRRMFCTPSQQLPRQLAELRTAEQLERRYSSRQLFTIYANRVYFGDGIIGVQAAAQQFFGKNPDELTIPQAALVAGLVNAPSFYSPSKHPERALMRRNEVIDAMLAKGAITSTAAEQAKGQALKIKD